MPRGGRGQIPNISSVIFEVHDERERQDERWGATHDDNHTGAEFAQLIQDYAGWARVMAGRSNSERERRRLIQVAALAIVRVEAIDRMYEQT